MRVVPTIINSSFSKILGKFFYNSCLNDVVDLKVSIPGSGSSSMTNCLDDFGSNFKSTKPIYGLKVIPTIQFDLPIFLASSGSSKRL
jgi:hypothetical protein